MNSSSKTKRFSVSSHLMIALIFAVPVLVSPQPLRSQTHHALGIKASLRNDLKIGQDQEANTATAGGGTLIRWRARPSVERYRLQLALDNAFNDIVFDRAVIGNTYRVTELPQGRYYWRIAPATTETEAYTVVGVVVIANDNETEVATNGDSTNTSTASANPAATPTPRPSPTASPSPVTDARSASDLLSPPPNTGWQTAIGEPVSLDLANTGATASPVLIATNADGTTYSLDVTRGIARWVSGFNPEQRRGEIIDRERVGSFAPIYIVAIGETTAAQTANVTSSSARSGDGVLVKFTDGVRLVDASSGREVWRTRLEGNARGAATDNTANATTILVTTRNPERLYFINRSTGRVERQQDLDSPVVGAPLAVDNSTGSDYLIATENGLLAFFDSRTTQPTRSVKLDTRITTAPLNVVSTSGARLLTGTERGLIALQTSDLSPVWRIATEGEPPTGVLAKADLDRDGGDEAVMITTRGRAAAVDIERGVIKWVAEGATDAMGVAFADVDNDGVLDVIVGAKDTFAVGFSGRDGKLVWSTEEAARVTSADAPQGNSTARASGAIGRKLIIATLPIANGAGNSLLLIGADPQRTILRAIRLTATPRRDAGNN